MSAPTLKMHPSRGFVKIRKREYESFNDNHRTESTYDCSKPCFAPREISRPKPVISLPIDYHKTSHLWTPNVTLNKSQRLVQVNQNKLIACIDISENKNHLRTALDGRGLNYRKPTIKQRNCDSQPNVQGYYQTKYKRRLVPEYPNESDSMIQTSELDYDNYRHDDFEEQYALPIERYEDSDVHGNSEPGYVENTYCRNIPKQKQKQKSNHHESLRQYDHSNTRSTRSRNRSNSSEDNHREQHLQNKRKQRNTHDRKRDGFITECIASSKEGHQIYAGQFENEPDMNQEKDQDNNKSESSTNMSEHFDPLHRSIIHTVCKTKLHVSNKYRQTKERTAETVTSLVCSNDPKHVFAMLCIIVLMMWLGLRVVGPKIGISSMCPSCAMPDMKQYDMPDTEVSDDHYQADSPGYYSKRQYRDENNDYRRDVHKSDDHYQADPPNYYPKRQFRDENNDYRRDVQYSDDNLNVRYPKSKHGKEHQRYSRDVPLSKSDFQRPSSGARYQNMDFIHDGGFEKKRKYGSAAVRYHSHGIVHEAGNGLNIAEKEGNQDIEEQSTSERERDESEISNRGAGVNIDGAEQYTSTSSPEGSPNYLTNSGQLNDKHTKTGSLSSNFRSDKNKPTSATWEGETLSPKNKMTPSLQPVKSAINTVTGYFQTNKKGLSDFENVMTQLHSPSLQKYKEEVYGENAPRKCCGNRNGRKQDSSMFERFNTFNSAIEDTVIKVKDEVLLQNEHREDSINYNKNKQGTSKNRHEDKPSHVNTDDKDTIGVIMCRSKFSFLFKSCNV